MGLLMMAAVFFSCMNDRQNPYQNPDNAKIEENTSCTNMTGILKAGTAYSCSVSIYLPALVDSMVVHVRHSGVDSIIYRTAINDSPLVVFSFFSKDTGYYEMQVIVVKTNGTKDSLPTPRRIPCLHQNSFRSLISPLRFHRLQ